MIKKWSNFWIMVLTLTLLAVGWQMVPVHAATTIPGKGTPSANATNILGIYLNTGFSLQPEDQYVVINRSTTLTTATGHSVLDAANLFANDHFQWYQSTNQGVTWAKVDPGNNANLTVTPNQVGTTYYQQSFQYYALTSIGAKTYYSRVAAINAVAEPIPATRLDVTADSNYLYNNQSTEMSTTVNATPTPVNATGKVTWSIDNTDLATIDSTTGIVTANNQGKSGTVTVTGTITNDDGSTRSGTTTIKIGGGLDDQTIDEGKTATFSVQGHFDDDPSKVVWHKVTASGKDTVVATGTAKSYTTPVTTADDDQAKFYAILTIDSTTLTTNKATLNVNINRTPNVSFTSRIEDLTDNTGNTDTTLNNVVYGDSSKITGTVTDNNAHSAMVDADFLIKMPEYVHNTTIKIDGVQHSYGTQNVDNGVYMVISGLSFATIKTHTFEVDFDSLMTTNETFVTQAEIQGNDSNNNDLGTFSGGNLTMVFSDGKLQATSANQVDFGSLTYDDVNHQVMGNVTDGGDLLSFTDRRRERSATTVTLSQETPFSNGSHDLAATLSFDDNGNLIPLSTTSQTVASYAAGEMVKSIGSSNGQSLALKLANAGITPGDYTTTLAWTITEAPQ